MKKLIVLIFNLSFIICYSYAQSWYVIDPTSIDGTPDFSDVFFTDDNTGWISSSSQANIFKTDNGAVSFTTQSTSLGTSTEAIYMIDADIGFCGGSSGFVYNTGDGGTNWGFLGTMATTLTDMDFVTASQGYACGFGGAVFSIAGGVTNLNSGLSTTLGGISAPSVDNVWVCGVSTISYYNGSSFSFQSGPGGTYNDIFFLNNHEGWIVGNNGVIGYTEDGGENWIQQSNSDGNSLYGVFFLNSEVGWAVGSQGTILQTTNGGTTWTQEGAGLTTAFLRRVHFTSTANGYVVGNGKTLIKYGLPLATKDDENLTLSFMLSQNYPNPFNPTTTIEYNIPRTASSPFEGGERGMLVQLKIYNILGNEVAILVDEEQPAGNYSIKFNVETGHVGNPANGGATSLQSGIYYYKLQVGGEQQTKKMVVLK